MNNFVRGTPRDHSYEVWSKSNERFQKRRCLSEKVYARRTTMDDGQRPVTIHVAHTEHFVLRRAEKLKNIANAQQTIIDHVVDYSVVVIFLFMVEILLIIIIKSKYRTFKGGVWTNII